MKRQLPERVTERTNPAASFIDTRNTREILSLMNREDQKVALAVKKAIPQITRAVDIAASTLADGGRLIYMGAGTSGRLGVLDAVECQPTFDADNVLAVLAGGPKSMFGSAENAEDSRDTARKDLQRIRLNKKDVLVGLAVSGRTPYTLEGLRYAKRRGAVTVGVTANPDSPMKGLVDIEIAVDVGPEIVAGSSRLKAGTAQKLVLNMLSTATMVRLGRVFSGFMIRVQMKNQKLRERGRSILAKATGLDAVSADRALSASGSNLPAALLMIWKDVSRKEALRILKQEPNTALVLRQAKAEHLKKQFRPRRRRTSRGKP